jgi:hypothetical protein
MTAGIDSSCDTIHRWRPITNTDPNQPPSNALDGNYHQHQTGKTLDNHHGTQQLAVSHRSQQLIMAISSRFS